jgi:hypothetical protein
MRAVFVSLILLLVAGCGTIGTVRKMFMSDPTVGGEQKLEYMETIEGYKAELDVLRQNQKQFIIFQYIAAGFLVAGGLMIFLDRTRSSLGIGFLCVAAVSSGWGLTASSNPKIIIIMMVCGLVLGFTYVIREFIIGELIKKKTISKP